MRGSRWQPHEDAVLAKVGAAAREAAPDTVRDRSVGDPVFLRYVADQFHTDPSVQERSDEAILTRLKKHHKAIATNRAKKRSSRSSSRSSRSSSSNDDCCSTHDDGEDDDDDDGEDDGDDDDDDEAGAQRDEDEVLDLAGEDAHPFSDDRLSSMMRSSPTTIKRNYRHSTSVQRHSVAATASSSASSDDEDDDHVDGGDDGWFPVPCHANRARLLRKTIQNSHIKFDDDSEEPIPPTATAKAEAKDDFTQPIETLGDTFANTHSQTHAQATPSTCHPPC